MGPERVTRALELAELRGPLDSSHFGRICRGLAHWDGDRQSYWPANIIDATTGERFECNDGNGTLVTTDHGVGREEKLELAARWGADLVDMEAATVARLAQKRNLPFRALRAISDQVEDKLPDLGRFTDELGGFREASFAAYIALHPWLIPSAIKLGRQSAQASQSIAQALRQFLQQAE